MNAVTPGKHIADHIYLHVTAMALSESEWQARKNRAEILAGVSEEQDYNVIKIHLNSARITLLDYADFFVQSFPVLRRYWLVDTDSGTVLFRSYDKSLNPPILHRKELLLPTHDGRRTAWAQLTAQAEEIGLFADTTRIGFRLAWEELIRKKGYRLVDNQWVPLGNDESLPEEQSTQPDDRGISRHLTALRRYGFSVPIQTLARFGLLDGQLSLLDYGCGRGDDVRGLSENGIEAWGWDPYYAREQSANPADIVNLGFVINVIENPEERQETLQKAYELTRKILVVSAMLAHSESVAGIPYADGIITKRNTFQKYHTQAELRDYIITILDEEPIAVGPGIFYVFKDKQAEQDFQISRQENRRNNLRLTHQPLADKPVQRNRPGDKHPIDQALLDSIWQTCLTLGRLPDRTECEFDEAGWARLGTLSKALRWIGQYKDMTLLEQARQSRRDDLTVYFAQHHFERKKQHHSVDTRLQRDIKAFFGDYQAALKAGRDLLFAAGQIDNLLAACTEAAEQGLGFLAAGHSLTLPTEQVVQLPVVLRVYVLCGLQLYGDVSSADLIKIHIQSGKLTAMNFDAFIESPLPRLLRRVKIRLRDQDMDIFDYDGHYTRPYLYHKSIYLNEESPHYAEQVEFDEQLARLGLFDFSGYGPDPIQFEHLLARYRWQSQGFKWARTTDIPALDSPCGRYLTYRQLLECSQTWQKTGVDNQPQQPESYTALLELSINILDPVIEYYGMIRLTYGFCSGKLANQIAGRIAPKLDQHAACERNRLGNLICERQGAAVDFIIDDEDMEEVALWISMHLPYDRLYYYGKDKPLHVSFGPQQSRQFVEMREGPSGKRVPRIRPRSSNSPLVASM